MPPLLSNGAKMSGIFTFLKNIGIWAQLIQLIYQLTPIIVSLRKRKLEKEQLAELKRFKEASAESAELIRKAKTSSEHKQAIDSHFDLLRSIGVQLGPKVR
jgi:hypothetical protein